MPVTVGMAAVPAPATPPPWEAPGSGPPARQEGVYTPTAHEGAPGRGDGPGSPPGEGTSPGGGKGPHAEVGEWQYGRGHSRHGTAAPPRTGCDRDGDQRSPPPPLTSGRGTPPPPAPPPPGGVTFVNANVTSLRAHYEIVFDFSSDFVGLQETRLTHAGQRCMQQLAKESGWDCFWGFPLSSPTGGIWGAPQGGGGTPLQKGLDMPQGRRV